MEQKTKILILYLLKNRKIEKNLKICRRVYQLLFINIADIFIEYIQSLDLVEIQQMDNGIKSNGWEAKSLLEIENEFDLLHIFQMFHHFNDRLPLTNGLLVVPDGEMPEGSRKISLTDLYEMFQGTKSHGLVSLQFLCTLDISFGGNISLSKNVLIELYHNLSYETLSGGRDFRFEAISDLTADMRFQMKRSTILNLNRKSEHYKKSNKDIKNSHDFFKKPGDDEVFENELKKNLYKELEHVKTDDS